MGRIVTVILLNLVAIVTIQLHLAVTPRNQKGSFFMNVIIIILHGYIVHQQYPSLYFPTNAHNVKKLRVIKTF